MMIATAGRLEFSRPRVLLGILGALFVMALNASVACAQADADHLQCYKVSDATLRGLRGTVDLDAPGIGVAPGCKLSKAKLYCVPARQTVQPGTLSNGGHPVTELPYHGPPAATDRICYRVKCPSPVGMVADQAVTDRFGSHLLRRPQTDMVCTPARGGTQPPPVQGFSITTPPIEVVPGQDITWCYYFRTPNLATLAVKRLATQMGPAGKGVVFFTTTENGKAAERRPAGDLSIPGCDFYAGTTYPDWRFGGYGPSDELSLPADDGNGRPVAMEIPPQSAGVLMMHFKNETSATVMSSVTLDAEALDQPVYTPATTLLSFDGTISIPPYATGHVESLNCAVPANAQFWNMTTFAHKQAVRTSVLDATNVLFDSFAWDSPGAYTLSMPPFHTFSTTFTHRCTYNNPTNRTITRGQYQQSDEQCVGVGYFFPGTRPRLCYNGYVMQ